MAAERISLGNRGSRGYLSVTVGNCEAPDIPGPRRCIELGKIAYPVFYGYRIAYDERGSVMRVLRAGSRCQHRRI